MRTPIRRLGRDYAGFGEGVSVPPEAIPRVQTVPFSDFSGGYDVRDVMGDLPQNINYGGADTEVSRQDKIIRSPGNAAVEALTGRTPEQMIIHAGLNFRSEIVLLDAPWFGVKREGVTTWTDYSLPVGVYSWATYGEWLIFSQGVKTFKHEFGTNTATEIPYTAVAPGASYASWAGRLWTLAGLINGSIEPQGLEWSGVNNFDDRDADTNGYGFEFLVNDIGIGDRGVALRPMGFDLMAILNRRSIWVARRTGDLYRPADIQPRIQGEGCVSERTARATSAGVIYLSDEGVKIFNGEIPTHISAQIDPEIVPIDLVNITKYWSTYNPHTQRYYLGVPNVGTYVYDVLRGRWSKRTMKALDGIPFAAQFHARTWAEATGSYGAQTETWADTAPRETDVPDMTFLGVKADAVYHLEKEAAANTLYFGYAQDPRWISYLANPADTRLATYKESRIKYNGTGTVKVQLPDLTGHLVDTVDVLNLSSAITTIHRNWRMKTGLGVGYGLRIIAGTPEIAGIELDLIPRSRKIVTPAAEQPLVAPVNPALNQV